jgi:hypothetical protein
MEPEKIRKISCAKIPSLKPVLRKWVDVNRELANLWRKQEQAPWWFNERAAVSVLAGAVAKCRKKGYYAFEEFVDQKHRTRNVSEKYEGRVDLYMRLKREEFIAEAKICWPQAEKKGVAVIEKHLRKAERAVKKCEPDGQKQLAIVFAPLSVKKANAKKIDQLISGWISEVKMLGDARAWSFPRSARRTQGKRHFHPGIAVFIKVVD